MTRYKLNAKVRYTTFLKGQWIISLEGVGTLGMSEQPEFKPGDEIIIALEGPINARPDQTPVE